MRLVYMGTPEFAVPPLSTLAEAGHEIVLVVSRPDRPKGRGLKLVPPPVKVRALELGLEVFQPEKIKLPESVGRIKDARPDAVVVAAYGQILPTTVLDIPALGCYNVHASLLPGYRGAAPINWCIINGETVTGVTIIRMDPGMDTGDMLLKADEPVLPADTAGSLTKRLSSLGAGLIVRALDNLSGLSHEEQDNDKATYAPMLKKETGRIDWTRPAVDIERLVRGLDPWPGAYSERGADRIKIWGAKALPDETSMMPGTVAGSGRDGITVAAGTGALLVTELQGPGGRRMSARDYLAGHKMKTGEGF